MTATKARNQTYAPANFAVSDSKANCIVAVGTHIDGEFNSTENVRIDGTVTGTFNCKKKLVLGKTALVEGQIVTQEAVIMGRIKGDIKVLGLLHLETSAVIEGSITAGKMVVEEGARYDGICKIG